MKILYTKTKIFHYKDKLDSLPPSEEKILAPLHIRIKPTNICGHSCRYCAYGKDNTEIFGKDEVKRVYIPKDKMMEILDDVIAMKVKAVTFSGGGDPFVYPFLLEAVTKLSTSPVKFASLTNGANLKGAVAEVFALHGTWVRVSMDGWDNASYSAYRGTPDGEHTKIIRHMRDFKKIGGKCYLGVSLIIDKDNAPHVYDILAELKSIGVDSVKMSPCLVNDNADDNNAYHRPFFDGVQAQVQKAVNALADDRFEIFNAYQELKEKFRKDYTWCPYLQVLPIIGADLNVYACPDKAYNVRDGLVGSIKDRRFKDFWFDDKNKFYKINPSVHCEHHCETNEKNKLIWEYLHAHEDHLNFA